MAVSAAAGVVAAVVTGLGGRWAYAPSIGWDVAGLTFLVWTWIDIAPMDATATASHATREDPSKQVSSLIVLGAAVASLAAVGGLLVRASTTSGVEQGLVALLGVLSVAVSWFVVHTLFTLRYALLYYGRPGGHPKVDRRALEGGGGIDFNQRKSPCYVDFAYLAFTIGMTFQVSDTALSTDEIRSTALRHALLSFLFGSIILASTVNLVASLASSSR